MVNPARIDNVSSKSESISDHIPKQLDQDRSKTKSTSDYIEPIRLNPKTQSNENK